MRILENKYRYINAAIKSEIYERNTIVVLNALIDIFTMDHSAINNAGSTKSTITCAIVAANCVNAS